MVFFSFVVIGKTSVALLSNLQAVDCLTFIDTEGRLAAETADPTAHVYDVMDGLYVDGDVPWWLQHDPARRAFQASYGEAMATRRNASLVK